MKTLSIDLETYSSADISKTGVYRYSESPDFEILLFSYSIDGAPVQLVDLTCGERIPAEVKEALSDPSVTKWAFNASFERICLSRWLGLPSGAYLEPQQWRCSMIWSAYLGLPLSLAGVGAILKLDKQKLDTGKDLIRYFCKPCRPTKKNGGRTRNLPRHEPGKWEQFKSYNLRDVETLMVKNAIEVDDWSHSDLKSQLQSLTALENPNSVAQMKVWLTEHGMEIESLGKKEVAAMLKDAPSDLRDALILRQQLAKSSVKKYQAMQNCVCDDGRVHGMFMFYGANRTGRFAGRLVQLQNLPQNHMEDLEQARALVRRGDYDSLKMLYDSVPDVLSELIRTAFIPYEGGKFIVADFSAIEARVIAWMAGETWRLEVFKNGGDIYCASASQMFGVPVEKHGVNGHLRQKGKIAELALGYGGSVGALKAMGALDMGIPEEELKALVDAWRDANPNITELWWDVDRAIKEAVAGRTTSETHGIRFVYESGFLFTCLPSGRRLAYVKPRIGENKFGGESVTYEGIGGTKKWERLESYGPKFVENIVQALSRDILCYAMKTLRCCNIVAHVHDEIIIEADPNVSLEAICEQMGRTPPWAKGLILRADGYETPFYKKD